MSLDLLALTQFVIAAKRATYVGSGPTTESSRAGSHDLTFEQGDWHYRDSYFGGTDFLGQEVVWHHGEPVWCMNYHGTILRPDIFDGARAAETLRAAFAQLHSEGRLMDNFDWQGTHGLFSIRSTGNITFLRGREVIQVDGEEVYALDYQAGTVKV